MSCLESRTKVKMETTRADPHNKRARLDSCGVGVLEGEENIFQSASFKDILFAAAVAVLDEKKYLK